MENDVLKLRFFNIKESLVARWLFSLQITHWIKILRLKQDLILKKSFNKTWKNIRRIFAITYTRHKKYTPSKIDQLASIDYFTVKNFPYHRSYFIHFLSKLYFHEIS